MLTAGVFVLGLAVGSFLNVLIYRLPRKLSFIKGRSYCPRCRKKISWFDNLPLLSFVLLKGRCRSCQSPVSWRYPLVELITGVGFAYLLSHSQAFWLYFLFSGLILIAFIDLEHQLILDRVLFPLFVLALIRVVTRQAYFNILVALLAALFLFLLYFLTRGRGMGLGDVKLAALLGLVLGFPQVVLAFYLAFLTGALAGVILILSRRARFGQKIAFGPYLCLGLIVSFGWGERLWSWLVRFL